ncbi:unnamed protein product [Sympodiomycopsis kandeliae]
MRQRRRNKAMHSPADEKPPVLHMAAKTRSSVFIPTHTEGDGDVDDLPLRLPGPHPCITPTQARNLCSHVYVVVLRSRLGSISTDEAVA